MRNYLIGMVAEDKVGYFLLEIVNIGLVCLVLSISRITQDHVGVGTPPGTVSRCVVAVDTET